MADKIADDLDQELFSELIEPLLDPFGDNTFCLKYTKNLGFWSTYCPGAWNYDAVQALVIGSLSKHDVDDSENVI